jgi:large conductance mechanosensitive channel
MRRNRYRSFFQEFRDFAIKGNVIDLAIAVIIGVAFGKIVESLIADIVTPLILKPALEAAKVEDLAKLSLGGILYGKFLAATLNFVIIAFVLFLIIRAIEATKRKIEATARQEVAEEVTPEPTAQEIAQERLIMSLDRVAEALENKV